MTTVLPLPLPLRAAVVPVGAPGAGKTTALTALAAELDDAGFRHGPDDVRRLAFGTVGYQGAGHLVHAAARAVFAARLASGRAAAFDATNTRRKERRQLVEVARRYGGVPLAVVFDVDERVLVARNHDRPQGDRVPDEVVLRHARRVAMLTDGGLAEEGFEQVHVVAGASA